MFRSRTKLTAILAVPILALGLLSACATEGPENSQADLDNVVVASVQPFDTFDPGASGTNAGMLVARQIFNTLIYRLGSGDDYEPGLATDYEVNDDATEFTFNLRDDVTFHDGTPFTANSVKATFDHIVDPATASRVAAPFLTGYVETRVEDDYTAVVVFENPYPAFAQHAAHPGLSISSEAALDEWGGEYGLHPVGTGPFSFVSGEPADQIVLERNDDYAWGPESLGTSRTEIVTLTIKVLSSQAAQYNALRTGEITAADSLSAQDLAAARDSGMNVLSAPTAGMPFGYFLNSTLAPTDDPDVREAVQKAVDRQQIIDTLFQGQYTASTSVVTPANAAYVDETDVFAADPEESKSLLEGAGWTLGDNGIYEKDGVPLKLTILDIPEMAGWGYGDMATLIQAQLKSAGIDAEIVSSPQATAVAQITDGSAAYNFAPMFYYGADPGFLRNVFSCAGLAGYNWGRTCDPEIDAAMDAADASTDQRIDLWRDVVRTISEDNLYSPIYDLQATLVSPAFSSLTIAPEGLPFYSTLK